MNLTTAVIIFGLVLFSGIALSAQDTLQVNFDAEYHCVDNEGYGFMLLIDNNNNQFQQDGKTYQVVYPENFFVKDTALAFNYFTGWEGSAIESTTSFLFGNYISHQPIVYVDYNHNLDFSDDGQPLTFSADSTLVVYLSNSDVPTAYFPIKFFYPKLKTEEKVKIEPMFKSMDPMVVGNEIVGIDYWLADTRLNNKVCNSWLIGKNIKIGLHDFDCNGLYNDEGQDRILIGDYESNMISEKSANGAVEYSKNVQISIDNVIYEVIEIEPSGRYLRLVKSDSSYDKPHGIGDYVGDLEIELMSGKRVAINKLQSENKYTLLDFWNKGCRGCIEQLPNLKNLVSDNSDKIQILGMNNGDSIASIEKFLTKHNIEWENVRVSAELMKQLSVDGFPNLLLLDPDSNIVIMNATLNEIIEKL